MATAAKRRSASAVGRDRSPTASTAEPGWLPSPSGRPITDLGRLGHALVLRLPAPLDTAAPHQALAEAVERWPVLRGARLWETRVPGEYAAAAARARALREALRPVGRGRVPLRTVLLRYADGLADLLLVADRWRVSQAVLNAVADLLVYGATAADAPDKADADTGVGDDPGAAPLVPWGLGDPGRAGMLGARSLHLPCGPEMDGQVLLAAVAHTLARYTSTGTVRVGRLDTVHGSTRPEVLRITDPGADADGDTDTDTDAGTDADAAQGPPPVGVVLHTARADRHYLPCQAPLFPLTVFGRERKDGTYEAECWFDEGAFAPRVAELFCASVERLAVHFGTGREPGLSLTDVPFVGSKDTGQILRLGGADRSDGPLVPPRRIDAIFSDVADQRPDAVALVDDTGQLTYRQLNERAERVAAGLRALGVRRGTRVGVFLNRDASLVVALLGVLKAGGAYVPIDVNYPADRVGYICENASLAHVIVRGGDSGFPPVGGVRALPLGQLSTPAPEPGADGVRSDPGSADDDAYVIYTSGSTGRPKGVVVPHRNVAALLDATTADFGLGPDDVWTLFHSSAFDFSVWEIWGCLLTGGRLVVVSYWVARDTHAFYRLIARHGVTVLNQTPSAFAQLARIDGQERGAMPVRLLVFGGESLDVRVLGPWFARHSPSHCRVVNMFGITETTVHVTARTITPADVLTRSRSVGAALPGWSVSVRDDTGRVLPPGAAGEIYVGGAGVADRYLGQPELTARRFVVDPITGNRLYRSGDRGRLHPDGTLDHLGRLDSQVKIRGHRIELDEIRSVLLDAPAVGAAVAVVRETVPGDPASGRIDAYVVSATGGGEVDTRRILDEASRILPDYMTPATLTQIASVPLTGNGKPDVARLPEPVVGRAGRAGRPDRQQTAADAPDGAGGLADAVLGVWSRCLRKEVMADDNFFELGGNSLLVVRVLSEMREQGLPGVTPRDFYANSTAGQFIRLVEQRSS
ncbi:non-ribosomal peptide synthetase [Streptomyces sp. NBC_00690]|uniref:non-ribosomal peptide synthetase n=1 Tax=Streptomyces sp. NBC_00690 TaxID=2975808 RepID=UPI002E2D7745|nr:non-ribosomal peptide synthetase [Streptomyces sp. NBC_00690]